MSKFKTLSSLLSLTLLAACGGSSDSNPSEGNSGGNQQLVNLTADVVQETICGTKISSANAELLIHDSNWHVLSRHPANANGKISANIPTTTNVNISLITYNSGDDASINVVSYAQHPTGDLGQVVVPGKVKQGCECHEIEVSVLLNDDYSPPYLVELRGHVGPVEYRTFAGYREILFSDVNVCRANNGNWPILTAAVNTNTPNAAAGVKQYSGNGFEIIELTSNYTPIPVSINSTDILVYETHYTDSATSYFGTSAQFNRNEVYVFNELDEAKIIAVTGYKRSYDYIENIQVTRSESQRIRQALPFTDEFQLEIPNSDAQQALQDFFIHSLLSDNTHYNLGNVQGFNTFYLDMFTTLTDGTNYQQTFFGPLQGQFPDDIVPADYNIDDRLGEDSNISIIATLVRYGDNQSYQQFLSGEVRKSRLPFTEKLLGEWSKYSSVHLSFSIQ